MLKKLTIHNLKVDLLHPIQITLTHFGESFHIGDGGKMVSVSDIYCQANRILFIIGKKTLITYFVKRNHVSNSSARWIDTPKKYRKEEL
jgi:hypothetical protein